MGVSGSSAQAQARLGRYELLARLAVGGMGEIYLARLEGAEGFEKLYVVKKILSHLADDDRFRQMLVAEAQIASKMSHPNICQVFELGETDGQLYIVMEYLEGVSLLPLLRRFSRQQSALDLGFVAGVVQQVTDAMNYAHELKDRRGENLGIVHRDITPSNIFLTETGVAKVLDFGIAKARGASTQTQEGTVKGKYAYMAPEQLKGGAIDRRVDIFALGIVVFEMLALRRLFQRKTDYLTFRAVMEQPIPDVRRYRPDVPDGVAEALARALDRDPANRYETARQLGAALLDGMPGVRPWSQGEISDFVRTHFADEIDRRGQQVANVVARTRAGVPSRVTMPILAHDESQHEGDDDDDSFLPVETEVEGAPPWMPRPTPPPMAAATGEFAPAGTPPPFAAETTGSAPMLQPIQQLGVPILTSPTQSVVVVHKRSLFWPIFGVAMVLIAAGALFLVWQQMQQPKPPAEIKITQETAPRPDVTDPSEPTRDPRGDAGRGSGTATTPETKKNPTKPKTYEQRLNLAIVGRKGALLGCISQHRADIPKGKMEVTISVNKAGRATAVSLSPGEVNASPLGRCLKNVLMKTDFPSGRETTFSVPLETKGA